MAAAVHRGSAARGRGRRQLVDEDEAERVPDRRLEWPCGAARSRPARVAPGTPAAATRPGPWSRSESASVERSARTGPGHPVGLDDRVGGQLRRYQRPMDALAAERIEEARRVTHQQEARARRSGHAMCERQCHPDLVGVRGLAPSVRRRRQLTEDPVDDGRWTAARARRVRSSASPMTMPMLTRRPGTGAIPQYQPRPRYMRAVAGAPAATRPRGPGSSVRRPDGGR